MNKINTIIGSDPLSQSLKPKDLDTEQNRRQKLEAKGFYASFCRKYRFLVSYLTRFTYFSNQNNLYRFVDKTSKIAYEITAFPVRFF